MPGANDPTPPENLEFLISDWFQLSFGFQEHSNCGNNGAGEGRTFSKYNIYWNEGSDSIIAPSDYTEAFENGIAGQYQME